MLACKEIISGQGKVWGGRERFLPSSLLGPRIDWFLYQIHPLCFSWAAIFFFWKGKWYNRNLWHPLSYHPNHPKKIAILSHRQFSCYPLSIYTYFCSMLAVSHSIVCCFVPTGAILMTIILFLCGEFSVSMCLDIYYLIWDPQPSCEICRADMIIPIWQALFAPKQSHSNTGLVAKKPVVDFHGIMS